MKEITLNVSANAVAWYGAIVSTIVALVKVYELLKDRARITINYKEGQLLHNTRGIYDEDKEYLSVEVINKGRRPVKITHVSAVFYNDPNNHLFADSFLQGANRVLDEKNPSTSLVADQTDMDIENLHYIEVMDATNNIYRKYSNRLPTFKKFQYWFEKIYQSLHKQNNDRQE